MKPTKKNLSLLTSALCGAALLAAPAAYAGIDLGMMGDVSYTSTSSSDPTKDEPTAFSFGGLDLFSTQKIDPQTSTFFELVMENDGDAFVVDVERYWIKHQFNQAFSLGAGRFHAPLGYWNRNFHHGVLLQDTPSRPGFLDFEDGATATLPMHVVGLLAEGKFGGGFGYELSYANSSAFDTNGGSEILIPNVADVNNKKAIFGRLLYQLPAQGLHVAGFFMNNSLSEAATSGSAYGAAFGDELVKQTVAGMDFRYEKMGFDVLAEYYNLKNKAQTGIGDGKSHTANEYYVQLGYRFADKFKAVYRHEDVTFDYKAGNVDEYFNIIGRAEPWKTDVVALRYEVSDSNALTLEYKKETPEVTESVKTTTLNWAFMMF